MVLLIQTVETEKSFKKSALCLAPIREDIRACIEYCKFYVRSISKLWLGADLRLKLRLQNQVFPSGVYCEEKIIRTKETALIFAHFQAKTKAEYQLVALRGFEPRSDD